MNKIKPFKLYCVRIHNGTQSQMSRGHDEELADTESRREYWLAQMKIIDALEQKIQSLEAIVAQQNAAHDFVRTIDPSQQCLELGTPC